MNPASAPCAAPSGRSSGGEAPGPLEHARASHPSSGPGATPGSEQSRPSSQGQNAARYLPETACRGSRHPPRPRLPGCSAPTRARTRSPAPASTTERYGGARRGRVSNGSLREASETLEDCPRYIEDNPRGGMSPGVISIPRAIGWDEELHSPSPQAHWSGLPDHPGPSLW